MASADFFALPTRDYKDLPRLGHIPSSDSCGIYHNELVGQGLYNDVLAYPLNLDSYAVSVRQYRIL